MEGLRCISGNSTVGVGTFDYKRICESSTYAMLINRVWVQFHKQQHELAFLIYDSGMFRSLHKDFHLYFCNSNYIERDTLQVKVRLNNSLEFI
jgi:hypothetical protein